MSEGRVAVSGLGFGPALAIAFIVLRLCGVIAWSWWWVLAPLWIPVALLLGILVVVFGVLLIAIGCSRRERRWRGNAGNAAKGWK